jgi:hypothetical protein
MFAVVLILRLRDLSVGVRDQVVHERCIIGKYTARRVRRGSSVCPLKTLSRDKRVVRRELKNGKEWLGTMLF